MPIHENPNRVSDPLGANELLKLMLDPAKYQQRLDELNQITQAANAADERAKEIIANAQGQALEIRDKAHDDVALLNDEFNSKIAQIKGEWERKALELDRREASLKAEEDEMAKQLASSKAAEDAYLNANQEAQRAKLDALACQEQFQKRLADIQAKVQSFTSSLS